MNPAQPSWEDFRHVTYHLEGMLWAYTDGYEGAEDDMLVLVSKTIPATVTGRLMRLRNRIVADRRGCMATRLDVAMICWSIAADAWNVQATADHVGTGFHDPVWAVLADDLLDAAKEFAKYRAGVTPLELIRGGGTPTKRRARRTALQSVEGGAK